VKPACYRSSVRAHLENGFRHPISTEFGAIVLLAFRPQRNAARARPQTTQFSAIRFGTRKYGGPCHSRPCDAPGFHRRICCGVAIGCRVEDTADGAGPDAALHFFENGTVEKPETWAARFAALGARSVAFHIESGAIRSKSRDPSSAKARLPISRCS